MNFSLAVGMQQDTVVGLLTAPIYSPHSVVIVPPCVLGDCLTADRTEPFLRFPPIKQWPAPCEGVCHLPARRSSQYPAHAGAYGVASPGIVT